MLLLVAQVLGVDANDLAALVAIVGEHILVALDAVGVVVPQDVPVPSQAVIAVVAEHVSSLLSCFPGNYGDVFQPSLISRLILTFLTEDDVPVFSDLISVSLGRRDFLTLEDIINEMTTQRSEGPYRQTECWRPLRRSLRRFKRLKSSERRVWTFDKHKQKHRRLSQVMKR